MLARLFVPRKATTRETTASPDAASRHDEWRRSGVSSNLKLEPKALSGSGL